MAPREPGIDRLRRSEAWSAVIGTSCVERRRWHVGQVDAVLFQAAWLDCGPAPVTAPHVGWIFAQRLAGQSAAGIARVLNDLGVPSPSAYDPARNAHRTGDAWTLRTVAEILANPRYTGRQVWNRQRTDHNETDPGDKRTRAGASVEPEGPWVISTEVAHPALVSEDASAMSV